MQKVKAIMSREVISVLPDTQISEAARLLLDNRINGLPVVDEDGQLVGIICQSDLIAQQKKFPVPSLFTILDGFIPFKTLTNVEKEVEKMAATQVSQAMTRDPVTVTPETPIEDATSLMIDRHFHTLPVVEGGKVVGVLGKIDILKIVF